MKYICIFKIVLLFSDAVMWFCPTFDDIQVLYRNMVLGRVPVVNKVDSKDLNWGTRNKQLTIDKFEKVLLVPLYNWKSQLNYMSIINNSKGWNRKD